MATADPIINALNNVKLAAVAVVAANERAQIAEQAYYAARDDRSEASAALTAAEKALLKAARA